MILQSVRKNKISSFFIVSLFIIIIMVGVYCVCIYNDLGVLSIPIVLICAILPAIISYYNCDKMVLAINGARPATREQDLQLSVILENLCISSGLPKPKLYVIEDKSPNAFATGRNPENAVICVTSGLLEKLDKYELEGVVAHEMSHIKNYDILLSTIVSVFVGFVVILSDWFTRFAFGGRHHDSENSQGNAIIAIIAIVFLILSPIFATLMQLAISRKREFLADATAIEFTRNPDGLISALKKISNDPSMLQTANKSTAHMYICNPLKGKKDGTSSDLWSTHPAVEKRIEALEHIK